MDKVQYMTAPIRFEDYASGMLSSLRLLSFTTLRNMQIGADNYNSNGLLSHTHISQTLSHGAS